MKCPLKSTPRSRLFHKQQKSTYKINCKCLIWRLPLQFCDVDISAGLETLTGGYLTDVTIHLHNESITAIIIKSKVFRYCFGRNGLSFTCYITGAAVSLILFRLTPSSISAFRSNWNGVMQFELRSRPCSLNTSCMQSYGDLYEMSNLS